MFPKVTAAYTSSHHFVDCKQSDPGFRTWGQDYQCPTHSKILTKNTIKQGMKVFERKGTQTLLEIASQPDIQIKS